MARPATHILLNYKSQDSEIVFRASDGVALGQRKRAVVVYGEDVNKKQSRVFLDSVYASRYLRETVPQQDLDARECKSTLHLEERDGEPLIQMPEGVMELPGGIRNFN